MIEQRRTTLFCSRLFVVLEKVNSNGNGSFERPPESPTGPIAMDTGVPPTFAARSYQRTGTVSCHSENR